MSAKPFDPAELVRWAENYGHPEEWAKKAQDAHGRSERLLARVGELEAALQELAGVILNDPADDAWLKGYVAAKLGVVSSDGVREGRT